MNFKNVQCKNESKVGGSVPLHSVSVQCSDAAAVPANAVRNESSAAILETDDSEFAVTLTVSTVYIF